MTDWLIMVNALIELVRVLVNVHLWLGRVSATVRRGSLKGVEVIRHRETLVMI